MKREGENPFPTTQKPAVEEKSIEVEEKYRHNITITHQSSLALLLLLLCVAGRNWDIRRKNRFIDRHSPRPTGILHPVPGFHSALNYSIVVSARHSIYFYVQASSSIKRKRRRTERQSFYVYVVSLNGTPGLVIDT